MIGEARHPTYLQMLSYWEKYRSVYEGGFNFIEQYTKAFSNREDQTDFMNRKKITYSPSMAKAAIHDIKHAIYQRMVDIVRVNGPHSYQQAVQGVQHGVDNDGNTMTSYIGRYILPELLALGKIGVYIDKASIDDLNRNESSFYHPYLYHYTAEDILSWDYDNSNQLTKLLLRDYIYEDNEYGLPKNTIVQYRLLQQTNDGILFTIYDADSEQKSQQILELPKIPFVIFQLTYSLLTDIADHQIALLNLASADMNYAIKGNFPFYIEQFDPAAEIAAAYRQTHTGQEDDKDAAPATYRAGSQDGRRYPKNVDRPAFIHPSSEPLEASMKKQEQIKAEIRDLININVANVAPYHVSQETIKADRQGLEAGLSNIGLELQYGESSIATIWAAYEDAEPATIQYPTDYSLKSDADRRTEARELREIMPMIPSITYQKAIAVEIINTTMRSKISPQDYEQMIKEVRQAPILTTDPEILRRDTEAGLLSLETASKARLYPDGEVSKAKQEYAEAQHG
jgi:hypothetical protein